MRPGDRRQRWRQSCNISGVVFLGFAALTVFGVDPPAQYYMAGFFLFMAAWDFMDAGRGWRIKEGRPPWADRIEATERRYRHR